MSAHKHGCCSLFLVAKLDYVKYIILYYIDPNRWFTVVAAYLDGDLELKQIYVLPVAPVQCQVVPRLGRKTNTTQHCLR